MIKIKITSYNRIKSVKFTVNNWQDPKLANIYKLVPEYDSLTLWINGHNYGTGTASELIDFFHQKWLITVTATKEFKKGLKDCIENGY
jgi:hypothetical protein